MTKKGAIIVESRPRTPASFWPHPCSEREVGARIDEISGSRVGAMCLGGLIWTPAIPHGVLEAQVIAPQPYARIGAPPGAPMCAEAPPGAEALGLKIY